ncbi:MAG: ferrous iron transport protein B, partial [Thermodesulfobacteriota bacterium]|nr:ferrous iron transport protein B [Thermodesulfobacteriota bacterium]
KDLHALAIMLFMALYPPCIPAAIAVKLQSGKYRWMLFSIFCPTLMGLIAAGLVFSGGKMLELSGLQAMFAFYGLALAATIGMGLIEDKSEV